MLTIYLTEQFHKSYSDLLFSPTSFLWYRIQVVSHWKNFTFSTVEVQSPFPQEWLWEHQVSNERAFSSLVQGPAKNFQLGLWAAWEQVVTLCMLTHLVLAAQSLLVLLWIRLTFCPHVSEDAYLAIFSFRLGFLPG